MAIQNLRDIDKFAEAVELRTAVVTRRLTLELFNGLTEKTPVDTGRARANWQVDIGAPAFTEKRIRGASTAPGRVLPFPAGMKSKIDGTETVWITNTLPYIRFLEEGSSLQAPNGMLALTVAQVQGEIDARILAEGSDI